MSKTIHEMAESISVAEKIICRNLAQSIYGDNALRDALYKPEKQTFWRRTKNKVRTVKERISNAWDALCGRLDYD